MKVLVTGGSGFLGKHLVSHFSARDFSRRQGLDVLNLQDVRLAGDYDVIIHLAAHLEKAPDAADEVFLTNVDGTINLLREVRENAVFIFASTKDVYGRFADKYDLVGEDCPTTYSGQSALEWSKLIAEKYVRFFAHRNNFRSCVFRLSAVYAQQSEGNLPGFVTHYASLVDKGERIRLPGGGRPVRDILHVKDLAGACGAFVDSVVRHGLYNLGGGPANALPLADLVSRMEEVSGYQAVIDPDHPLPNPIPMNYVSDLGLVTRELDWRPEIDIDQGLSGLFGR